MKSCYVRSAVFVLGTLCLAAGVHAQDRAYGSSSLLPLPQGDYTYPVTHVSSANRTNNAWSTPALANSPPPPAPGSNPTLAPAPNERIELKPYHDRSGHTYGNEPHAAPYYRGSPYMDAMSSPTGSGCVGSGNGAGRFGGGSGCGSGAGSYATGFSPCARGLCGPWFGSVGGLIMTRDDGNPYPFSYDSANEEIQLTNTRDASMQWGGGVDVRFGRYFNCNQNAVEFVYWGVYPSSEESTTLANQVAGGLNGILNWDQLDYDGAPADGWVDNAEAHRVRRDFEFHNLEVNLLQFPSCYASNPCGTQRFCFNWGAGVRYFRFAEHLQFGADDQDTEFTGAANEIYYDIGVKNNLIGFQLNAQGQYYVTQRLSLLAGTKFGLFANHINHHSRIGGAWGDAIINNGPNEWAPFNVKSNKNDIAFLGELNVGLNYQMSCCWSATLGYRAVAVTGVALPSNQIYSDLRGIQDVAIVDSNGSLILHGGYAGVQFNY
jgi:hypothetical protein